MENKILGNFNIYVNDGNYGNIYPEENEFLDKGVPFISASDFSEKMFDFIGCKHISKELHDDILKKGHVQKNDIIIVVRGNGIGKVGMLKDEIEDCNINAQLAFIRVLNDDIDPDYLYYLLKSEYYFQVIRRYGSGSAQPQLPLNRLMEVPICYFENKTIQRKIGYVLSALDSKIIINNKINAELEAMAKTLYDYWFLQFEFPNEEGKPYKSSGGKMVWNEELKREIPEGWEVGTLSQIANITMGSSPKGESLNDEKQGIIFYQGKTDFGFRFPVTRMYTISPVKCANIGDILLSVRAPVGSMNIANEKCCIGRGLAAISGKCKSFLYYMMLANQFQFDKYNNGGTTFGAITKDDLFGLKIIVPNNKIIQRFNDKICHMDKLIEKNEKENQELADLRDFLLPILMNGQVGFKD